ncbi:MAG: hypothetical protein HZA79_15940 [Sphingobacteriales bacterium]|nr:hypothetical protein [Sphingobacteriales bacterium]
MKKILSRICILLFALPLAAQETAWPQKKSGLSFSAGINVPIMCFAAEDPAIQTSGFAKPGFTLDISYTCRFNTWSGIKTMLYFSSNKAGNSTVPAIAAARHYRAIGWMAGPLLSKPFSGKWEAAFSPLAGISKVWTPQLSRQNETWLYKQSATCFSWGGDLSIAYYINDKSFLHLKTGHLNMTPKFSRHPGENAKSEQHFVLVNVDAGFGWKF